MITRFQAFNESLLDGKVVRVNQFTCHGEAIPIISNVMICNYLKRKHTSDINEGKKSILSDIRQDMVKLFGKSDVLSSNKFEFRTYLWHLGYKDLRFAVYCNPNRPTSIELYYYKFQSKRYDDIIEFLDKFSEMINTEITEK